MSDKQTSLIKMDGVRFFPKEGPNGPTFEVAAKDVVEHVGGGWYGSKTISHVPDEWKGVGSDPTPSGVQEIITLSEEGLFFYLSRSDKPAALPFQKKVAGEILPSIRRTGSYSVKQMKPAGKDRKLALSEAREARLNRKLKIDTLEKTLKRLHGKVSEEALTSLEVSVAEIALERELPWLKPAVALADWQSPKQIADRLGTTKMDVGRAISHLGLRGDIDGISKSIINKAEHCDRNVVSYLYSPDAIRQIEDYLADKE